MTDRTETRTETRTAAAASSPDAVAPGAAPAIAWLEDEFPGWTVTVDETATWEGDLRALWIARREGHHPQAELTAAKLHTRLTEYIERQARRTAFSN